MTKDEFVAALRKSPIWKEDRYGHFQLTFKGNKYRLKVQPLAVRFETKRHGYGDWWSTSSYYKNVEIKDGRLVIDGYKIPLGVSPE